MALTQRLFETLRYRLASDSGLTTPASSSVATTGTGTAGSASLTVASATSFSVGHGILVANAGTGGGDLATWITAIASTVFTLHDKIITEVTAQAVTHDDRFCVPAAQIIPATGNLPVVFPCIVLRLEGAEGYDFRYTTAGELFIFIYVQSEPGGSGYPLTRLNMIADRIYALYHRQEDVISNAAVRMQGLVEVFKSGTIPESDISETTHSQALRYEVMANIA